MRYIGWLWLLSVLVIISTGAGSWAATNPLTGATLERPGSVDEARPSILLGVGRSLLMLQRTLNRAIGRHLRAIRDGNSPRTLIAGLAFAFLYGVLHTLGPGHGKVVVVSYFVSREARLWRGVLMGVQIAVTHVLSAFVLLWATDLSLKAMLGDSTGTVRGVQLVSYGAMAAISGLMLIRAVRRSYRGPADEMPGRPCHHGHEGKQLGLMSVCVGLLPCTGAVLVMLYAVANDMVVIGTVMVATIAVGMAVTMSAVGMLAILTRGVVVSRFEGAGRAQSTVALTLEVAGALSILIVSSVLFAGSL